MSQSRERDAALDALDKALGSLSKEEKDARASRILEAASPSLPKGKLDEKTLRERFSELLSLVKPVL